jgi:hypothetical protein
MTSRRRSNSTGVPEGSQPRIRDYAAEYRRRHERAKQQGFSGYAEQRRYRRAVVRQEVLDPVTFHERDAMLKRFGVTLAQFNNMRAANLKHVRPKFENWNPKFDKKRKAQALAAAIRLNEYNVDIDLEIDNWSERRVGYITSFYRAIVDPRYNYTAWKAGTGSAADRRRRNRYQADLLVKYAEIMDIDEFERRYGGIPQ